MLGLDDPALILVGHVRILEPDPAAPWPDALTADDVVCFGAWAAVLLPDITLFPGAGAQIHRRPGPATQATVDRHNRHWRRAHRPPLQLPEAPI